MMVAGYEHEGFVIPEQEAKEALDKILNQCDRGHRVIRI